MTLIAIASFLLVSVALLLYFLGETAFDFVFGYIGASAVCLVSFGRIRMEPLDGRESELASAVGVVVTIVTAICICYVV